MRMRQSLSDFEQALAERAAEDRARRETLVARAERRAHARRRDRVHKRGRVRFAALCVVLLGTAVLVAVAMFQALYWVMG